LVIKESLHSSS